MPAEAFDLAQLPKCTAGKRAAPLENSGGVYQHYDMMVLYRRSLTEEPDEDDLKILSELEAKDEDADQDIGEESDADDDDEEEDWQDELCEWLDTCSARLGREYVPHEFDAKVCNRRFKRGNFRME